MPFNIIKNTILVLLSMLIFTACTPKDVTVYQQEDELLNCRKLTGKIAELMNTNAVMNQNTGLEDTSMVLWYFSPLGGVINQIKASKGRDKIDSRFDYLLKLKERQDCEFTDKEIEFSKLQGKGRFSEDLEKWDLDYKKKLREMKEKEMESQQ